MNVESNWDPAPGQAGQKSSMSDGYDFSALRVLVVDDSFHMRELVRTFLEGFGIKEVTVSSDAEEAYDLLTSMDPDLVITDLQMPYMTGIDLCSELGLFGGDFLAFGFTANAFFLALLLAPLRFA